MQGFECTVEEFGVCPEGNGSPERAPCTAQLESGLEEMRMNVEEQLERGGWGKSKWKMQSYDWF